MQSNQVEVGRKALMIDNDLYSQAKQLAESRNGSISEIVCESLLKFFGMTNNDQAGSLDPGIILPVSGAAQEEPGAIKPKKARSAKTRRPANAIQIGHQLGELDRLREENRDLKRELKELVHQRTQILIQLQNEQAVNNQLQVELRKSTEVIKLAENKHWHLQGTIEALQWLISNSNKSQ